ncbi:MAG: rod shape-determining protein [Clostridia bacterium]|nr:rod shape-determining protein [Clostridia bacterium]
MLGTKIGFDLGTSSTLALVDGKGVRVNEPSVIAYDTFDEKTVAIGNRAQEMLGRSPDSITVVQPIKNGSIYDYEAIRNILTYYIEKLCGNKIFKPSVALCVPANVTALEKRSVLDLTVSSGAARACIIDEALAAALGAGVDINDNKGTMIVDIGGGTTDIAVITKGCIAESISLPIAGNTLDEDIIRFAKREKGTVIGEVTAESVKSQVGSAVELDAEIAVRAVGKDYVTKLPKSIEISSSDVYSAISDSLNKIVDGIKRLLRGTSGELTADLFANGIIITGGGANLMGIDKFIEQNTDIRTRCAENPELCVINGIGILLDDENLMRDNGYEFKSYMDIKETEE